MLHGILKLVTRLSGCIRRAMSSGSDLSNPVNRRFQDYSLEGCYECLSRGPDPDCVCNSIPARTSGRVDGMDGAEQVVPESVEEPPSYFNDLACDEELPTLDEEWDSQTTKLYATLDQTFGVDFRSISGQLARRMFMAIREHPTHRWLSELFTNVPLAVLPRIERLLEIVPRMHCAAVVWHPDSNKKTAHVHYYHLCNYRQSFCRCIFTEHVKEAVQYDGDNVRHLNRRNRPQRILHGYNINPETIINWIIYYSQEGRRILFLDCGGAKTGPLLRRLEDLREHTGAKKYSTERSMEVCDFQGQNQFGKLHDTIGNEASGECSQHSQETNASGDYNSRSQLPTPRKVKRKRNERDYLLDALQEFLAVPVQNAADCENWINDPELSIYDKADPEYRNAVTLFQKRTALMDFKEITDLHRQTTGYYLSRRNSGFYDRVSSSLSLIFELLEFQLGTDWVPKMKVFHGIMERETRKLNTVCIKGPPNSGKTFFADWISGFYINTGQVGNFNRSSTFPLNDCPNRRLLIWNEPNIEPTAYDTVKMLTGGDPLPCNVKYQSGGHVDRTPLIITTNAEVFQESDPLWSTRVMFWYWKEAPFLKECSKSPHPMAYIHLIEYIKSQ